MRHKKIFNVVGGIVCGKNIVAAGGCGELDTIHSFVSWVEKGGEYPNICRERSDQCWFVALTDCGELMTFERTEIPVSSGRHLQAYGSGSQFAMGALGAGVGAKQAVEIASSLDPHTGGPVHTFTHD